MMTEIVRCACSQIAHAHGFEMQHTNGTEIWKTLLICLIYSAYMKQMWWLKYLKRQTIKWNE